jgi:hypothetical protein
LEWCFLGLLLWKSARMQLRKVRATTTVRFYAFDFLSGNRRMKMTGRIYGQ